MAEVQPSPTVRTAMVPVDGSRLFVRDVGAGRPVVVLHGGPEFDHRYFLPELDVLARDMRLVYFDQRGRGSSYAGTVETVTIESEVADIDRIRAWADAPAVTLLGHSWGALLALEYAIRHPDRVLHLVLMNPAPVTHRDALVLRDSLRSRRSPEGSARMAALRSDTAFLAGDIDAEAEFYRIHFGSTVKDPERLDDIVRRLRIGFTPEASLAARAIDDQLTDETLSAEAYDLTSALRSLHIPTLVLRGEDDFIPLTCMLPISDAIAGSRLVEISDSGHFAFVEQPERVREAIASFIAGSTHSV